MLGAIVAGLFAAGVLTGGISPGAITDAARAAGPLAPVAFVVLGAALTCLLFPGQVTAALAGALFGIAGGFGLALSAAVLGAAGAFLIARLAGGGAAEHLLGPRALRWREWVREHGFGAVVASRLLPGTPAGVISYAAGLSRMRVAAFAAAVALGALPKTAAYVALGGALHDPLSARGMLAAGLYAGAAAIGVLLARRGIAGARRMPGPRSA